MEDRELIGRIRFLKEERGYTLYELSKRFDIQVATVARWLKTDRINRLYAEQVKERLSYM